MEESYFQNCKEELEKILTERKSSSTKDEASLQSFFEKYPFAILSCLEKTLILTT
jgi:hypothetical protein